MKTQMFITPENAGVDPVLGGNICTGLCERLRPDDGQPMVLQAGGWALGSTPDPVKIM